MTEIIPTPLQRAQMRLTSAQEAIAALDTLHPTPVLPVNEKGEWNIDDLPAPTAEDGLVFSIRMVLNAELAAAERAFRTLQEAQ